MFFSISAYMFSLIATAGTDAVDISFVFVHLYSLEASSVIYKDPSHSNNASISFILLELILILLCRLSYMCFVFDR